MSSTAGRTCMVQGRIVWVDGDLFAGNVKTDLNTKQPKIDPKTGKPMKQYGFGLAIPKSILGQSGPGQPGEIWTVLHEEAYTLFPSRQIPPTFAMKFKDGDGIDNKGISFAQREGYAGHIVLACTTSLPIKFFKYENGNNILINEGIKCGDYVNVQVSVKAHPAIGQGKAGLYVNPNAVQLLGYGKEIINTPSGDAIFGTAAPVVPQGASATPIAPAGMLVPPSQVAPPAPNWNVVPQQYVPAAAVPPAMPPTQPVGAGSVPTAFPSNGMPLPPMPR